MALIGTMMRRRRWVTEKGDSRDPFTQDDAGGAPAPQLI
jgi:hypothetical protein